MSDNEWDKSKLVDVNRTDKWVGEDEDDDIKDNWDDEEDDDEKVAVVAKQTPVATKKKKIKNYEDKYNESRAERKASLTEEEKLAEKLERQRLQEESDLLLAKEAFGDDSESKASLSLSDITLSTKEDFDTFKKSLVTKLVAVERSAHYVPFLETMFRELCASLESDDIKRISGSLTALFNEKVKAHKAGAKTKKKGKGFSLKVERNEVDFETANDLGDYDDFI